jgi:hypothetical protein
MNQLDHQPVLIQRLESGFIAAASLYFYLHLHFSWVWFIILLLTPDLFMVGYMSGSVLGAKLYNLGHNYGVPAVLLLIGAGTGTRLLLAAGLIWAAHVGMDRALGYGLKFGTGFKDTHLGRL